MAVNGPPHRKFHGGVGVRVGHFTSGLWNQIHVGYFSYWQASEDTILSVAELSYAGRLQSRRLHSQKAKLINTCF